MSSEDDKIIAGIETLAERVQELDKLLQASRDWADYYQEEARKERREKRDTMELVIHHRHRCERLLELAKAWKIKASISIDQLQRTKEEIKNQTKFMTTNDLK